MRSRSQERGGGSSKEREGRVMSNGSAKTGSKDLEAADAKLARTKCFSCGKKGTFARIVLMKTQKMKALRILTSQLSETSVLFL